MASFSGVLRCFCVVSDVGRVSREWKFKTGAPYIGDTQTARGRRRAHRFDFLGSREPGDGRDRARDIQGAETDRPLVSELRHQRHPSIVSEGRSAVRTWRWEPFARLIPAAQAPHCDYTGGKSDRILRGEKKGGNK